MVVIIPKKAPCPYCGEELVFMGETSGVHADDCSGEGCDGTCMKGVDNPNPLEFCLCAACWHLSIVEDPGVLRKLTEEERQDVAQRIGLVEHLTSCAGYRPKWLDEPLVSIH